ncbi:MAG: SelT/SelW/SelH family protein [Nocardiaceae bacterium]|nr:SelT/SelW/SelH family protein [Nocardiaceae bacterium]
MTAPAPGPKVRIEYCTLCHWLLRASWMAQELLSTFPQDLSEVTLVPGTGGIFRISLDAEVIWDRKEEHGFPDIASLKQIVRDRIEPDRDLGHIDRSHPRRAH